MLTYHRHCFTGLVQYSHREDSDYTAWDIGESWIIHCVYQLFHLSIHCRLYAQRKAYRSNVIATFLEFKDLD